MILIIEKAENVINSLWYYYKIRILLKIIIPSDHHVNPHCPDPKQKNKQDSEANVKRFEFDNCIL